MIPVYLDSVQKLPMPEGYPKPRWLICVQATLPFRIDRLEDLLDWGVFIGEQKYFVQQINWDKPVLGPFEKGLLMRFILKKWKKQ
jgi:hypothetical protein